MTVTLLEKKLKPYEDPMKDDLAKWLYLHFPPRPIATRKMYDHYRQAVRILVHEIESGGCVSAHKIIIQEYLNSVLPFLEAYEKGEFELGGATPEEVLKFLMEQNHLSQYDIAEDLGGQPVVSDVLRKKRKLTRNHIERLSKRFKVSPAAFFPY